MVKLLLLWWTSPKAFKSLKVLLLKVLLFKNLKALMLKPEKALNKVLKALMFKPMKAPLKPLKALNKLQ